MSGVARHRRMSPQAGSATVEFVALVPYLLIAAAFAWQVLLLAAVATAAQDAARTGGRAQALGRDGSEEALDALSPWMRERARVGIGPSRNCEGGQGSTGTRITVCVEVPLLWPGLSFPRMRVVRDAEFPPAAWYQMLGRKGVTWA